LFVLISLLVSVVSADDADEGVDGGADTYDVAKDLKEEDPAEALARHGRDDEAEPKVQAELEPKGAGREGRLAKLSSFEINGVLPLTRRAAFFKRGA
jgi:hypothetical protein